MSHLIGDKMNKKYIELSQALEFFRTHAVVINEKVSSHVFIKNEIHTLLDVAYDWEATHTEHKTSTEVAKDIGIENITRSVVTSIGAYLSNKGLVQHRYRVNSKVGRYYCMPPLKK